MFRVTKGIARISKNTLRGKTNLRLQDPLIRLSKSVSLNLSASLLSFEFLLATLSLRLSLSDSRLSSLRTILSSSTRLTLSIKGALTRITQDRRIGSLRSGLRGRRRLLRGSFGGHGGNLIRHRAVSFRFGPPVIATRDQLMNFCPPVVSHRR